ncbi:alginate O-acetyltransferase AlgX-related protein [Phascolarctobacterium succinatutens]|uniref:alginate O-acetyltransferase AlgX-related protein n=1 Tax=Phascolarctobacterium succinatutens TaxID=626940 RepID=UPI00307F009E
MKNIKRGTIYKAISGFFLLLLVIPNIGLLREKTNVTHIAIMENRTINPKPTAAFATGKFFKEFEAWYDDRLLGRKDLISKWAMWNGRLFDTLISKNVVRGKDGFLFSPANMAHEMAAKEQKLAKIKKIEQQCSKRGIRFIFMLTPNSELVLSDLFEKEYPPIDLAAAEQITAKDFADLGMETCFLGKEFTSYSLSERKNMYHSGDYHWTDAAGYLAAKKFLHQVGYANNIDAPVKQIKVVSKAGIYYRDAGLETKEDVRYYPWSDSFTDEFYVTDSRDKDFTRGKLSKDLGEYGQYGEDIIINKKVNNNRTILVLGDSFSGRLKKYLLQDVHMIVYSHSRDLHKEKGKIDIAYMLDRYKPDIVLFQKMEAFGYREGYEEMLGNIYVD